MINKIVKGNNFNLIPSPRSPRIKKQPENNIRKSFVK